MRGAGMPSLGVRAKANALTSRGSLRRCDDDELARQIAGVPSGLIDATSHGVVPCGPETLNNAIVEILIRVEERHGRLRLFVASDEAVDLVAMSVVIFPRRGQIFERQAGNGRDD